MVIAVVGIVMNHDGGISVDPKWGKRTTVGKDGLPSRKNWENNR